MPTTLYLFRHGRATGQGPDAVLLPEGEAYVASLGRALAREGFRPVAAYASPFRRARDTANILLGELGSSVPLVLLDELIPERYADEALAALQAHGLPDGPVLVVSHLPLVARLTLMLTGDEVDFQPGTLAEIRLDADPPRSWLARSIGDGDPLP